MREKIDRRSSSYISCEVYHEAGKARTGVFCSGWTSGAVVVVPKKFFRKDIVNTERSKTLFDNLSSRREDKDV